MGHFFQSYVKEPEGIYVCIYIYMVKIGDITVYNWDLWWVRLWLDDVRWADRVYPVRFLDVDYAWLCWKPKMIQVASASSWNSWRCDLDQSSGSHVHGSGSKQQQQQQQQQQQSSTLSLPQVLTALLVCIALSENRELHSIHWII